MKGGGKQSPYPFGGNSTKEGSPKEGTAGNGEAGNGEAGNGEAGNGEEEEGEWEEGEWEEGEEEDYEWADATGVDLAPGANPEGSALGSDLEPGRPDEVVPNAEDAVIYHPGTGLAMRVATAIVLLSVLGVVILEVIFWFDLAKYNWPSWYRHPASVWKPQLDDLAQQHKQYAEMTTLAKKVVRANYQWARTRRRHDLEVIALDCNRTRVCPHKKLRPGVKSVEELRAMLGPTAGGVDWWVALAGILTDTGLVIVAWAVAEGCAFEGETRLYVHVVSTLAGVCVSTAVGVVMALWMGMAATDPFGVNFMIAPLIYCLSFLTIALLFFIDFWVTKFDV